MFIFLLIIDGLYTLHGISINPFTPGTLFIDHQNLTYVYRRQIPTYKDDPRPERINTFILAVDP